MLKKVTMQQKRGSWSHVFCTDIEAKPNQELLRKLLNGRITFCAAKNYHKLPQN